MLPLQPRSRLFQRAVEPLHLALRLMVADPGEAAAHSLFHQPYRELGPAVGSTRSLPWHAMIHQTSPQAILKQVGLLSGEALPVHGAETARKVLDLQV
jgi:hypothetical protein